MPSLLDKASAIVEELRNPAGWSAGLEQKKKTVNIRQFCVCPEEASLLAHAVNMILTSYFKPLGQIPFCDTVATSAREGVRTEEMRRIAPRGGDLTDAQLAALGQESEKEENFYLLTAGIPRFSKTAAPFFADASLSGTFPALPAPQGHTLAQAVADIRRQESEKWQPTKGGYRYLVPRSHGLADQAMFYKRDEHARWLNSMLSYSQDQPALIIQGASPDDRDTDEILHLPARLAQRILVDTLGLDASILNLQPSGPAQPMER